MSSGGRDGEHSRTEGSDDRLSGMNYQLQSMFSMLIGHLRDSSDAYSEHDDDEDEEEDEEEEDEDDDDPSYVDFSEDSRMEDSRGGSGAPPGTSAVPHRALVHGVSDGQANRPSRTELKQAMQTNDFSTLVQQSLGPQIKRNLHLTIADRECRGGFTHGQMCQLSKDFVPNSWDRFKRYPQKVFCGTFSKDGNLFLSACQDNKLRLYDSSHGRFIRRQTISARQVGWSILDTAMSPDGRHVIYTSWCDSIFQVDVSDEGEDARHVAFPLNMANEGNVIFSVQFSADGLEVLGGANYGSIYLFDRHGMACSLSIQGHDDDVNAVAFIDSATHVVASAGDDGLCKVWDRRALRESHPVPVGAFAGHVHGIVYIDPRGDGRYLITNSKDQSIKLWDLRCFSSKNAISETRKAVNREKWDYRWQSIPRQQASVNAFDSSVMTYHGHCVSKTLIRCHFSPAFTTAQKYIYTGCSTGHVLIYDVLTGDIVQRLSPHSSCVRDVSWHPYLNNIISSSWDNTMALCSYRDTDV